MSNFKVFVGDNNNQAKYVGQIPDDATIAKINNAASLPDQTGNSGKFLTTNGTDTSWSGAPLVNKNTSAYGLKVTTLYDVSAGAVGANVFGYQAYSSSTYSVVIGGQASISTNSTGSIAIGNSAQIGSNAAYAIQLGSGTNSTERTLKVGLGGTSYQYELLSADGTIPEARLADTTSATTGQVLQLDSNNNANWSTISEVASQSNGTIKFWTGTQTQYDAITTKDATTLYIVIPAS